MANEQISQHLELIQSVVSRMASNSFVLKGWSVTLGAALFALAAKDSNPHLAAIAIVPATAFWGLDAYYLRQERLFRCLYNVVRKPAEDYDPFSMDTSRFKDQTTAWWRTALAPSVALVHGAVVLSAAAVFLLIGG